MPYETIIDVELASRARYRKQFPNNPWEERQHSLHRVWNVQTVAMDSFASDPEVRRLSWNQPTMFMQDLARIKKEHLASAELEVDRLTRELIRTQVEMVA